MVVQRSPNERLQILEDIESIRKLKARACYYADSQDADGFSDLFAEDGVFEGAFQKHVGRDAIARSIQFWPLAIHYITNPIIETDGHRAVGQWFFLRPQSSESGEAAWVAGWYEDEYVKIGGAWKFKRVSITNLFAAPYEVGWTLERSSDSRPSLTAIDEFIADRIKNQ